MELAQAKTSRPEPDPSAKPAPQGLAKAILLGWPMVVLLLALHWLLAVSSVTDRLPFLPGHETSPTFDEPVHLLGGYSYYRTGDYRLNAEAGVLSQRLAALPLLLGKTDFPSLDEEAWNKSDEWSLAYEFFYHSSNDPLKMLFLARAFMALVSVALGLLVYFWSRRLFGPAGGVFSLALYAFSPAMLANGPLSATDVTSALCFLLASGCFWRMLHVLSVWRVLASGLTLGLLFVSKMSAPVALLFLAALFFLRVRKGGPLELTMLNARKALTGRLEISAALAAATVLNAVMVLAIIWTAYSWSYSAFADPAGQDQLLAPQILEKPGFAQDCARFCGEHRLLPQAYLYGMVFTAEQAQVRGAFLNGDHYATGRAAFFPYAFAVKTPLSALAALALAALAAIRWRADREGSPPPERIRDVLYRTTPLWVLMIGFWLIAMTSHINIGARHLLPAYGPMLILMGVCGTWLESKARALGWLAKGVLAAALLECVLAWPNYLAYFNVFAGGTDNGYKHLVDSSLDWGQDLPALRGWLSQHASILDKQPVYLSYFGMGSPTWYGLAPSDSSEAKVRPVIPVRRLAGFYDLDIGGKQSYPYPLSGGAFCISATMLQGLRSSAPGPWVFTYERVYQRLRNLTQNFLKLPTEEINQALRPRSEYREANLQELLNLPPEELNRLLRQSPENWGPICDGFVRLRLGRLFAYLRQRTPLHNVGGTILIYTLTDAEAREAVEGPPAELLDDSASTSFQKLE